MSSNTYPKYTKLKIYPTPEQKKFLDFCINTTRYVYNWALSIENEQYRKYLAKETDKQFVHEKELRKIYHDFIEKEENQWLKKFQIEPARYIFSRLDYAFEMYFKGYNKHPKFKSRKRDHYNNKHSYRIRHDRFYCEGSYVRIPGFKRGELIDCKLDTRRYKSDNIEYHHVEVIKDNLDNYYVSFQTYEEKPATYFEDNNIEPMDRAIGIDLNARANRRFVCSDGDIYSGRDISSLQKHISNIASQLSRDRNRLSKMEKTNPNAKLSKRANERIIKFRNANKRIHNIGENEVQLFTKRVIDKNPSCVVMETLGLRYSMKKNKCVERYIHFIPLYRFREVMRYKCDKYNIPFKLADRTYPSSQLCSNCGNQHKIGSSVRVYSCPKCGFKIDRDLNAAINLEKLAYI